MNQVWEEGETREGDTEEAAAGETKVSGRLTERDKQLLGILARSRYLSTEQVTRLVFQGRNERNVRRRLDKLRGSGHGAMRHPAVRRLSFRKRGGDQVSVWALSSLGYSLAEGVINPDRVAVPSRDVGEAFLEHAVTLNELYVALLCAPVDMEIAAARAKGKTTEGIFARARHPAFRWFAPDSVGLPWRQWDMKAGMARDRLIQPDAVLEVLPADGHAGRRCFLECEMGTQTVVPTHENRPGSTLSKAQRYASFILGTCDAARRVTHYAKCYPDGLAPEVLYLVRTSTREATVNEALRVFGHKYRNGLAAMRAVTFTAAARDMVALIGRGLLERRVQQDRRARSRRDAAEPTPALRTSCAGAIAFMKEARARARSRGEPVPDYPAGTQEAFKYLQQT